MGESPVAMHIRLTDWLKTTGSGCVAIPLGGSVDAVKDISCYSWTFSACHAAVEGWHALNL